jgi:hypothetical protein
VGGGRGVEVGRGVKVRVGVDVKVRVGVGVKVGVGVGRSRVKVREVPFVFPATSEAERVRECEPAERPADGTV